MIIHRLKLKNVRSHENTEIVFNERIIFIMGLDKDHETSNFAGKSTILEGIIYGLFGKSKLQPKYLVRTGTNEMAVEIDLEDSNNKISIKRDRIKGISDLDVTFNGTGLQGKPTEKQDELEKILGVDYNNFINYSVIDNVKFLDMEDISTSELKQVLIELVQLDKIQYVIAKFKNQINMLGFSNTKIKSNHYPSKKRLNILNKFKGEYLNNLTKIEQELSEYNKQIGSVRTQQGILNNEISKHTVKIQTILSSSQCPTCLLDLDISRKNSVLNQYQKMIAENKQKVEELEISLKALYQTQELQNKNREYLSKLNKVSIRISQLNDSFNVTQSKVGIEDELHLYTTGLQTLNNYLSFALTHVGAIIEDQVNSELSIFSNMVCKLNLFKTQADGQVTPSCYISVIKDNVEYKYSMLSGGEKTIIAILFKIALNSLRGKSSIFLLDEGLDRLDEINRERLLNILESSVFSQIFVISHKMDLTKLRKFQKVYVIKTDGVSKISDYI